MSRYSLRPLAENTDLFEVALGWDLGLGTYFVIVFGPPDHEREPDIRLWRGTSPHEIGTPAEILALAAAYAEIPDGLGRKLEIDRLRAPHNPDRHQPDAVGGGGFMIDATGIHWIGTSMVHDRARFSPKLVIAMRDAEEGLVFWNERDGFGSLGAAQVYTEEQTRSVDLPITDNQPEWLALPASLVA